MNPVFSLSKSNKIFSVAVSIVLVGASIFLPGPSPERIGGALGILFVLLLFPAFLSWIAWRVSGRMENAGSTTFNVVLALMLFGQFARLDDLEARAELNEKIENDSSEYQHRIATADTSEEARQAYEEHADSAQFNLRRLARQSAGKQRDFYNIMAEFTEETQNRVQRWNSAFYLVQSDRILDSSLLNSEEEFNFQRKAIDRYLAETREYSRYFFATPTDLKKRLDTLGEGNQQAAEALQAYKRNYDAQQESFTRLLKTHLRYGAATKDMLEFLHANTDAWDHEDGKLLFHTDELIEQYRKLHAPLVTHNLAISEISQQLMQ